MSKISKEKFISLLESSEKLSNNCMLADASKGDYHGCSLTMLSERGTVTFGVVHSKDGNGARIFNKNMNTINEVETPILLSDYKEIEKIMKKINKRLSSLT